MRARAAPASRPRGRPRPRSPTRCSTRPACGCGGCRLLCLPRDDVLEVALPLRAFVEDDRRVDEARRRARVRVAELQVRGNVAALLQDPLALGTEEIVEEEQRR